MVNKTSLRGQEKQFSLPIHSSFSTGNIKEFLRNQFYRCNFIVFCTTYEVQIYQGCFQEKSKNISGLWKYILCIHFNAIWRNMNPFEALKWILKNYLNKVKFLGIIKFQISSSSGGILWKFWLREMFRAQMPHVSHKGGAGFPTAFPFCSFLKERIDCGTWHFIMLIGKSMNFIEHMTPINYLQKKKKKISVIIIINCTVVIML